MSQSRSDARLKRPALDALLQDTLHPSPQTKKPRFNPRNPSTLLTADDDENGGRDEEDDLILNADVIGKSGTQTKRNAVRIEGYGTDSEGENFDLRAAEKERKKTRSGAAGDGDEGEEDEDEEDMFADLDEKAEGRGTGAETVEPGAGKRKKDVRFLDAAEIEGQVMSSKSGGHVPSEWTRGSARESEGGGEEEEESSESGSDTERDLLPVHLDEDLAAEVGAGGKKKHAPRLDAFNLKAEEEDGRFDEAGNYVRKAADPDAVNDNWLEGLSKKDMRRAREAQEKRERERRRREVEDDATLTSDLLSRLIAQLETGETALEALQRLQRGKAREKKGQKWKHQNQRKLGEAMEVDEPASNGHADPVEEKRKSAVDAITAAADALYSRGQPEVYDTERELLMRQYRRETGEDWRAPAASSATGTGDEDDGTDGNWEYRWSDARDGGERHGPYDAATMKAWNDAGYFGEGVEFRRIGAGEWSRVLDVT